MPTRRSILRSGLLSLVLLALIVPFAGAQASGTWTIQGVVTGSSGQPLQSAIVYLKNTQTNSILTYITERNGSFIFSYAPANVDYSVWAMYKGRKSESRTISSFVSRKDIHLDLHMK